MPILGRNRLTSGSIDRFCHQDRGRGSGHSSLIIVCDRLASEGVYIDGCLGHHDLKMTPDRLSFKHFFNATNEYLCDKVIGCAMILIDAYSTI